MAAEKLVEKEIEFLSSLSALCGSLTPADVERLRTAIAEAAYYRAERRGFAPGHEMSDWLEAEKEIRQQLDRYLACSL